MRLKTGNLTPTCRSEVPARPVSSGDRSTTLSALKSELKPAEGADSELGLEFQHMLSRELQPFLDLYYTRTNQMGGVAETGPVSRHLRFNSLSLQAERECD